MSTTCQKKCIPPKYKDSDLTKGETVCIDRCVAKYMEIHDRIGKKLTSLSQQDEERMKQLQAQMQQKWLASGEKYIWTDFPVFGQLVYVQSL